MSTGSVHVLPLFSVVLTAISPGVAGVAVTPDGRHIISASWDNTLKLGIWIPGANSERSMATLAVSLEWR